MNLLEDMKNPLWKSKNVIYCYTNKINGKKYVGQVCRKKGTLKDRHNKHLYENLAIDNAIKKYGIENFSLEILHIGKNLKELNYFEDFYILYYNSLISNGKGYNIARGGSNGNPFEGKSEKEMKEIRKKQSDAHKGEKNPMFGKKQTRESNEKRSKTLLEQRENKDAIINVGNLWNKYKDVNKIIEITGLHRSTVCRYLKKCNEMNITNYDGTKTTSIHIPTKIVVIDKDGNEYIFDSMKQCENKSQELFGIKFCHINRYINKNKPYKEFIFKSVE